MKNLYLPMLTHSKHLQVQTEWRALHINRGVLVKIVVYNGTHTNHVNLQKVNLKFATQVLNSNPDSSNSAMLQLNHLYHFVIQALRRDCHFSHQAH